MRKEGSRTDSERQTDRQTHREAEKTGGRTKTGFERATLRLSSVVEGRGLYRGLE